MSTDRELLELAAKAAGVEVTAIVAEGIPHRFGGGYWNPLDDDSDALRLAATLRLQVKPGKHKGDGCTVETQRAGIAGCTVFRDDEPEQMRQAIVRAAAEIGKAMP